MSDVDRLPIYDAYVQAKNTSKPTPTRFDIPWTPRRFAQDDWLLALWVWSYIRTEPNRDGRFAVGLFLAEDHKAFVKGSGERAGLLFCLSEAYHQTGKMQIEFFGSSDPASQNLKVGYEPNIPEKIRALASDYSIDLDEGNTITDEQGRALYLAITGVSLERLWLMSMKFSMKK